MKRVTGLTVPHTAHCLGTGDVMVSAMGDTDLNGKGIYTCRFLHYVPIINYTIAVKLEGCISCALYFPIFVNMMLNTLFVQVDSFCWMVTLLLSRAIGKPREMQHPMDMTFGTSLVRT